MDVRFTILSPNRTDDVAANLGEDAVGSDLLEAVNELGFAAGSVRVDGRPLAPDVPLSHHPLEAGSVMELPGATGGGAPIPGLGSHVVVVAGPDAGTWRPLVVGQPVRVGRTDGELRLRDDALSRAHARFDTDGTRFLVTDLGSSNGTFVEGAAVTGKQIIQPGDFVGLGDSVLTVVVVTADDRAPLDTVEVGRYAFPRPFREARPTIEALVRVPRPVPDELTGGNTWWRALIPLVSGAGFAVMSGRWEFLLLSALAPVVMAVEAVRQKRARQTRHQDQQARWRQEASKARDRYLALTDEQRRRQRDDAALGGVAVVRAAGRHRRLWERRPTDADFLHLPVGLATVPAATELVDETHDDASTRRRAMWGTPLCIDLPATGAFSIIGPPNLGRNAARAIAVSAATTHAPTDVQLWLFTADEHPAEWGPLTWLPHFSSNDHLARVASTSEERSRMFSELRQHLQARAAASSSGSTAPPTPAHVAIFDGARTIGAADLSALLEKGPPLGIYGVIVDPTTAPDGSMGTLSLRVGGSADFESRLQPRLSGVTPVLMTDQVVTAAARRMAALQPASAGAAAITATSARVVDQLGISVGAAALAERWRSAPGRTDVPVGTTADATFGVDIVRDGPHGLVGGKSRSGKTEFLKTWITSLAWNNHPDQLSFVIVDFKGAVDYTLAESLPHVLDVCSNADLSRFERTVRMLSAEMERRQRLFRPVNVANLNAYEDLRRGGQDLTPIPRLVVLVDEFAELTNTDLGKDQMKRLESMSRVGAGLGVHLVLITQSFEGKLPTQIATNAGMRLCFRVEQPADSSAILDVGIASTIPAGAAGRAYARLQGGDPIEFQSARVAGRRRDLTTGESRHVTLRLQPFGGLRTRFASGEPQDVDASESDMFQAIELMTAAAELSGWQRPAIPWPAELPDHVEFQQVKSGRSGLTIPIGLADQPDQQAQTPFPFTIGGDHLALLGGARADLNGVLLTLGTVTAGCTSPDDVHLFVIDFNGRGLSRLGRLPHCDAVASRNDAVAVRIARHLVDEAARRRSDFEAAGVASLAEYVHRTGETLPVLLVLIAGGERLSTMATADEPSEASPLIAALIAEGSGLGIQIVVAGTPTLAARRPGSAIDHRIVLTAPDVADYVGLGAPRGLLGQLDGPRRAIDIPTSTVVQLTSLGDGVTPEADVFDLFVDELEQRHAVEQRRRPPRRIREVTWPVRFEALAESFVGGPNPRALGLGIDREEGDVVWIEPATLPTPLFVTGGRKTGKTNALAAFGETALRTGWHVVAIAGARSWIDADVVRFPVADLSAPLAVTDSTLVLIDDVDQVDIAPGQLDLSMAGLVIASGPASYFGGMQRFFGTAAIERPAFGLALGALGTTERELLGIGRGDRIGSDQRAGQAIFLSPDDLQSITIPLTAAASVPSPRPNVRQPMSQQQESA
ncbi:MAG: FtsK/SpoIIIE domain-containing protein [Desertimonas sp.]